VREVVTASRIREFMRRLGAEAKVHTKIYLTGGATAVLFGWRDTTIDVDVKIIPDSDDVFQAIPALKESLQINVELASPDMFIPPLPGWEERSLFISQEGNVSWYHYDPYSQALSKIERGHQRDARDVQELIRRDLVKPSELRTLFAQVVPQLIRYPAIDPEAFANKVDKALGH
jgi:hypothetical protein